MSIYAIRLLKVVVGENGDPNAGEAQNLFKATWFFPRENTPSSSSLKSLKLKDEVPLDLSSTPFYKSGLFKEKTTGESQLVFEVTDIDEAGKFLKFLSSIFKGLVQAFLGKLTGGIGNVILKGGAEGGSGYLLSEIKGGNNKVQVIGMGTWEFSPQDIPTDGEEKIVPLDLFVPKTIKIRKLERTPAGAKQVTKTLTQGQKNGQLQIAVRKVA